MSLLALVFAAIAAGPGRAETFPKTPAYFVVLYGFPEHVEETTSHEFLHPDAGRTTVSGKFSVRKYRHGDYSIEAVFFRPALTLAAVTYTRSQPWEAALRDALLAAYGSRWKEFAGGARASDEGAWAVYAAGSWHFLSPRILGAMDEARAAQEKAR